MMTTHYKTLNGEDITSYVYHEWTNLLKDGSLQLPSLIKCLLCIAADDSELGRSVFSSILTQFAIYMCCDGVMNLTASDAWWDHIAAANDELVAILCGSSIKDEEHSDALNTNPKGGVDI